MAVGAHAFHCGHIQNKRRRSRIVAMTVADMFMYVSPDDAHVSRSLIIDQVSERVSEWRAACALFG